MQKTEAEAKAKAELISAEAEAKANKKLSNSITDQLIKMKEAEARLKHAKCIRNTQEKRLMTCRNLLL